MKNKKLAGSGADHSDGTQHQTKLSDRQIGTLQQGTYMLKV